jgi:hypothetical protein
MPPSIELLKQLRSALLVEQEKRWRQKGYNPSISARVQLYQRLDGMRARREALGRPYAPPTQAERDDLQTYLSARAAETAKQ